MKKLFKVSLVLLFSVISLAGWFPITAKAIGNSQTISPISFNSAVFRVSGTGKVSATATSGLPVTFNSMTPSTCAVLGHSVIAITVGTCTVVANQIGSATYYPAPTVTQSIPITKGNQAIGPIRFSTSVVGMGGTITASATTTSNLPVIFSSSTPTICAVSGNTVTGIAPGLCTVVANQPGDTNYNAANRWVAKSISIAKASQSINFATGTSAVIGATTTLNATATSGLPVSFSTTTPSICTVSGSKIIGVALGICSVVANQVGDANYNSANQMTLNITVKALDSATAILLAPTINDPSNATLASEILNNLNRTTGSSNALVFDMMGSNLVETAKLLDGGLNNPVTSANVTSFCLANIAHSPATAPMNAFVMAEATLHPTGPLGNALSDGLKDIMRHGTIATSQSSAFGYLVDAVTNPTGGQGALLGLPGNPGSVFSDILGGIDSTTDNATTVVATAKDELTKPGGIIRAAQTTVTTGMTGESNEHEITMAGEYANDLISGTYVQDHW